MQMPNLVRADFKGKTQTLAYATTFLEWKSQQIECIGKNSIAFTYSTLQRTPKHRPCVYCHASRGGKATDRVYCKELNRVYLFDAATNPETQAPHTHYSNNTHTQ